MPVAKPSLGTSPCPQQNSLSCFEVSNAGSQRVHHVLDFISASQNCSGPSSAGEGYVPSPFMTLTPGVKAALYGK